MARYKEKRQERFFVYISSILTLAAFALSLYMFWAGQANTQTFSYIGEANRTWYFFYSLIFVLAFSLNIIVFTIKNHIKSKRVVYAIYTMLALAVVFSLLQSIIIDPAFHEMHIILAGMFTGFGCLALITAIISKLIFTKSKHGYYYLVMLFLTGGINFYAIYAYGWLIASYQWLFASTVLATSCALALINNEASH